MRENSLGIGESQDFELDESVELECGDSLSSVSIRYETYGALDRNASNAILVCHALTGGAHAAGKDDEGVEGWWNNIIGPGKALDTDKYFVICSNVLGGCKGSTGPSSVNPEIGEVYGTDFPFVTVKDMVNVQKRLVEQHLDIDNLMGVIGGSFGGMQALQWAVSYPESINFCIPIATTARSSPQQIALDEVRRQAIINDSNWNEGDYYGGKEFPRDGLKLARMIGHIGYLSEKSMKEKFGRELREKENLSFGFDTEFEVESYLDYNGEKFVDEFDPNSYLYITRAIDYFDLTQGGEKTLEEVFKDIEVDFKVIGISSDWLYPPYQSKQIVDALKENNLNASYSEINSNYGHDAFILEEKQLKNILTNFLNQKKVKHLTSQNIPTLKPDATIQEAAQKITETEQTHIPVINRDRKIKGIVTAWDIAQATAKRKTQLKNIITRQVKTANPGDSIEPTLQKMTENDISALPVTNKDNKVKGIITQKTISQHINRQETPAPGVTKR